MSSLTRNDIGATFSGDMDVTILNDPMPTTPVTGTFWQATQPVSGTFWQATQPVSIASTVTVDFDGAQPVTGTFWQATQPVSISGTVPVSGTVTATIAEPLEVDGTVTANISGSISNTEFGITGVDTSGGSVPISGSITSTVDISPSDVEIVVVDDPIAGGWIPLYVTTADCQISNVGGGCTVGQMAFQVRITDALGNHIYGPYCEAKAQEVIPGAQSMVQPVGFTEPVWVEAGSTISIGWQDLAGAAGTRFQLNAAIFS